MNRLNGIWPAMPGSNVPEILEMYVGTVLGYIDNSGATVFAYIQQLALCCTRLLCFVTTTARWR